MEKTITLGNWKAKDSKESLAEAREVWFLKDIKTNKYYSLFGMEPNTFNKKDVNRVLNSYCGKSFLGYPIANKKSIFGVGLKEKEINFKKQFKIVSIFDYIKDIKKEVK